MTRRIALRVAFDGAPYHGTQRQPTVATVNDAILTALGDADMLAADPRLRAQGRLDAGVSARDYTLALDVQARLETAARVIAGRTTGIVPWAGARVHARFDPRFATRWRMYRYHLPRQGERALDTLVRVWQGFEGAHDFSAFSRIVSDERDQDPNRRIQRARARRMKGGVLLDVRAPTFLRQQVRRMVGSSLAVARGELERGAVQDALAGGELRSHHVAPAQGLTLWRVGLSADWIPLPEAEAIGRDSLAERVQRVKQQEAALGAVCSPTRSG